MRHVTLTLTAAAIAALVGGVPAASQSLGSLSEIGVPSAKQNDTVSARLLRSPWSRCKDSPRGWKSTTKHTCADYQRNRWCTRSGGYGAGWKHGFGTFDRWAVNGISADEACCVCGGGQRRKPPRPTRAPTASPTKVCTDSPRGWASTTKHTCADYKKNRWCTSSGGYGTGWKRGFGTFDRWAVNGISADEACCVCGGGGQRPMPPRPTMAPTASPTPPRPTMAPTASPTKADDQCQGDPCDDKTQCRSEFGYCGDTGAHCTERSQWLPECDGTDPGDTCRGQPCQDTTQCRSEYGYCGNTHGHCTERSQWKPDCDR